MSPRGPAYLAAHASGALAAAVEQARDELRRCRVCPRDCDVDRLEDEIGVCRTGRYARVASAFAHFGEEDCLRGTRGSGTIFFGCCNLRCVFCQNYDISWERSGREVSPEELAELMVQLQEQGCHNINFVTPEHVVPQVLEALPTAIERGLRIPLVYNTSAYDSLRSLELLDGVVDIYMPDFKFWEPATAKRLAFAENYPEAARAAVREMHRQVGELELEDGLAVRGLLVRHLVMPEGTHQTRQIMRFLAEEISPDTYVNIMDQYHPAGRVGRNGRYAEIDRRVRDAEMRAAMSAARDAGLWRFDERGVAAG